MSDIQTIETSDHIVFTADGRILYDLDKIIEVTEAIAVDREKVADVMGDAALLFKGYAIGSRDIVEQLKRERDLFAFDASI